MCISTCILFILFQDQSVKVLLARNMSYYEKLDICKTTTLDLWLYLCQHTSPLMAKSKKIKPKFCSIGLYEKKILEKLRHTDVKVVYEEEQKTFQELFSIVDPIRLFELYLRKQKSNELEPSMAKWFIQVHQKMNKTLLDIKKKVSV